jgi:hypothetical protein
MKKRCVYTALIGRYEKLNEQPLAAESPFPFICLTDDKTLESKSWEVRHIEPQLSCDAIRSQRELKIRAHRFMQEFDESIYIDNSVLLNTSPVPIFDMLDEAQDGVVMMPHSFRHSLLDEFLEVWRLGLDDEFRIFEQLNHYWFSHPDALSEKPWWGGLIARRHNLDRLNAAMDTWASHVLRYSRRDQLSVNIAFRQSGIRPLALKRDNHWSEYHRWPITIGRDCQCGSSDSAAGLRPSETLPPGSEQHFERIHSDLHVLREREQEWQALVSNLMAELIRIRRTERKYLQANAAERLRKRLSRSIRKRLGLLR